MTTSPTRPVEPQPPLLTKYKTVPDLTDRMPRAIPFIVVNEFAERFSFYGMKAILIVFMTQYMIHANGTPDHLDRDTANIWQHNFNSFVYFTPVLGALIADIVWGKYNTILWISLLYCVGHGVLAMGETRMHLIIGLTLIGIGAGGIKPCVSANVGDQFSKKNQHLLTQVYNWFYFSINLGAFLAQMMIPLLLAWYGPKVAFGVPGILMAIAAVAFWMGRKQYVHAPPLGLKKVMENFTGENLKILIRLVIFFMFVAPFYALYDEGSGSWVDQAKDLDLTVLPGWKLLQSQVQATNAILILVFIPLFAYVIYPLLGKFVNLTPKRKIAIGLFTMIPAFLIAYYIEKRIVAGDHPSVWWQILAYAILTAAEIMVSVPALEFAYQQAPKKMKSMIMAAYLAGSISFGNVVASFVVSFITSPTMKENVSGANRPNYYLVFTGLIAVAAFIYCIVAWLMPEKNFIGGDEVVETEIAKGEPMGTPMPDA